MAKNDLSHLNTESHIVWFDDLGTGNEEYRFLSNFYEGHPLTLPGIFWQGTYDDCGSTYSKFEDPEEFVNHQVQFATGEHAFQAMKSLHIGGGFDFHDVATADSPGKAKSAGRSIHLRSDWEIVKYDVMAAVVRQKFAPGREEAERLLATGDRLLVEGTFWKDTVWGVDLDNADDLPGRNWLGTLLMARRAELRSYEAFGNVKFVADNITGTSTWNSAFIWSSQFATTRKR